jgi:hypothetical protein
MRAARARAPKNGNPFRMKDPAGETPTEATGTVALPKKPQGTGLF